MPNTDPRVDEYINNAADFAKPILHHLRALVHKACPQIEETIKWSFPNFNYRGGILGSMAAFKQHAAFNFWMGSLMTNPDKILLTGEDKTSMGSLGKIKTLNDLPPDDVFISYIHEAMLLKEKGIKVPKKARTSSANQLEIPAYFTDVLRQNPAAFMAFEKFSPSHKKEYLEWITEAKTEPTRNKRIATTIEWLTEGKTRNWKYSKC